MLTVGTTVDLRALTRALDARARRAADLSPWYRGRVDPDVSHLMAEQFESRGSRLRGGHRWKQLALSTIDKKGHDQPLVESGELMEAFANPDHPDASRIITRLTYRRGVKGRAAELARFHDKGTRHMPARPIAPGIPAPVRRAWSGSLLRYLSTGTVS